MKSSISYRHGGNRRRCTRVRSVCRVELSIRLESSLEGICRPGLESLRGLAGVTSGPVVEVRGGHVQGMLMASAWALRGRPVELPFCTRFFAALTRRSCCSSSTNRNTWRDRRDSSDFTQAAGPVDLVERVLQVHGQKASSFVVTVALKPSSDGVECGFTAVHGPNQIVTGGGTVSPLWRKPQHFQCNFLKCTPSSSV